MTYVRATGKYALLVLSDSNASEHDILANDVRVLLSRDFTTLILDFNKVTKFNSHILALVLGIYKVLTTANGTLAVTGLDNTIADTFYLCGLQIDGVLDSTLSIDAKILVPRLK